MRVLSGAAVVGPERAVELFESAYDEHARRLAKLYGYLGLAKATPSQPAPSAYNSTRGHPQ